jgi:hypothetical protein
MAAADFRRNYSKWELRHERPKERDVQLDNSGDKPLCVPGFGLPVDFELPADKRFAHRAHDWAQPRMTAREMAMLRTMNAITDMPGWHVAVMDDEDVEGLRPHPFSQPLLSDAAWAWCVAELRDKAVKFRNDHFVTVMDSGSCIVKSDTLIPQELLETFQKLLQPLIDERKEQAALPMENKNKKREAERSRTKADELAGNGSAGQSDKSENVTATPNWSEDNDQAEKSSDAESSDEETPSDDSLSDLSSIDEGDWTLELINPNDHPLVYGKTLVLADSGTVGLDDACESIGKGKKAPTLTWDDIRHYPIGPDYVSRLRASRQLPSVDELLEKDTPEGRIDDNWRNYDERDDAKPYLYSRRVQWLPCEVSFNEAETARTGVHITSYINGLHPLRHKELYSAIEDIIAISIEPWNAVLVRREAYQQPLRIRTYGVEWQPAYPDWAWDLPLLGEQRDEISRLARGGLKDLRGPKAHFRPAELQSDALATELDHAKDEVARLTSMPQAQGGPYGLRTTERPKRKEELSSDPLELEFIVRSLYRDIRTGWQHPEPGAAYSYHDWRAGTADSSVIPPRYCRRDTMAEGPEHRVLPRPVSLKADFQNTGLQVFVRLTNVELSPEHPEEV